VRNLSVLAFVFAALVFATVGFTGCDDATESVAPQPEAEPDVVEPPVSLATQLGLTQYSGAINPVEEARADGVITYTFDPAEGPVCMRGAPFRASVRDAESDDLVIFLQGGGACWSAFCLAVTGAPLGIPGVDVLDPELDANPVRDWNQVYLPYCDGSFFAGDAVHADNLNGKGDRIHRGLANLTGALEVAKQHFDAPRRVLLAGSSGGAYGLLLAGPLVRHYYPDAELIVMADSGIGLGRDGDEAYMDVVLDEFNVRRFLPDDCADCRADGHITGLIGYFLARDDNVRVGMYSSWYDSVLATTFLQVPAAQFADGLDAQSQALHDAWPDRFRRFIADGNQHTSLLGDPTGIIGSDLGAVELPDGALARLLGGDLLIRGLTATQVGDVTMAAWLTGLIDNDLDVWVDLQAERGPPPEAEAPADPPEE
jgi:hypothetical protein